VKFMVPMWLESARRLDPAFCQYLVLPNDYGSRYNARMRYPERGRHEFPTIASILDESLACYVGFVTAGRPVVIPTIHGRIERRLYLHGSALSRWMNGLVDAMPVCVTASVLDGIVLARSAYQHSMNYRSVVAFGEAAAVVDDAEKVAALRAITERVCAGRWADVRLPARDELRATLVLRVPIDEASARIRAGAPIDFEHDLERNVWAGVVPLRVARGEPVPAPNSKSGIELPKYLSDLVKV
jgi:nitroimidazol reductase NimA-like FMN-containing flavoprotein (pyridoxamine 5'-phosphate oxidase superfamily)